MAKALSSTHRFLPALQLHFQVWLHTIFFFKYISSGILFAASYNGLPLTLGDSFHLMNQILKT